MGLPLANLRDWVKLRRAQLELARDECESRSTSFDFFQFPQATEQEKVEEDEAILFYPAFSAMNVRAIMYLSGLMSPPTGVDKRFHLHERILFRDFGRLRANCSLNSTQDVVVISNWCDLFL
jgi:hypothetical protein